MGPIFTVVLSAGALGVVAGVVVGYSHLPAGSSFAAAYAVGLLAVLAFFSAQGPFLDVVLGTLNLAVASLVPAGSGYAVGIWVARWITTRRGSNAP